MIIVRNVGKFYFFLNGTISSLMGIGGGTLSVPYISFLIDDIKKSIATASALGLVIAITSIIFMYMINLEIFYSKINHLSLFLHNTSEYCRLLHWSDIAQKDRPRQSKKNIFRSFDYYSSVYFYRLTRSLLLSPVAFSIILGFK